MKDDIIGKKIRNLTVIKLDTRKNEQLKLERKQGFRTNAPAYYICKCDCGQIVSLQKSKIKNNKSYNCKYCRNIDFTKYVGEKINHWTILEYIEGQHKFKCRCDCGTIKNVNCYNLIKKLTNDCGCGRKKKVSEMASIDSLVGQTYGKLTVLEEIGKNKYGKTVCKCQCECGNIKNVLSNSLRSGHTKSCGCVKSYQQTLISSYLKELNYTIKEEKTVILKYENVEYIRFDIYVEELNLVIEYDGEAHFIPIDWSGKGVGWAIESLKQTQFRDKIKDKYCYDNDIYLLRIPYTEKDNYKQLINETINIILK